MRQIATFLFWAVRFRWLLLTRLQKDAEILFLRQQLAAATPRHDLARVTTPSVCANQAPTCHHAAFAADKRGHAAPHDARTAHSRSYLLPFGNSATFDKRQRLDVAGIVEGVYSLVVTEKAGRGAPRTRACTFAIVR